MSPFPANVYGWVGQRVEITLEADCGAEPTPLVGELVGLCEDPCLILKTPTGNVTVTWPAVRNITSAVPAVPDSWATAAGRAFEEATGEQLPPEFRDPAAEVKPEPTRLPARALLEVAKLMTAEADAHDDDRWRSHSVEHHLNAAWRHLLALQAGEEIDPRSGFPHRHHAAARLLMAVDVGSGAEIHTVSGSPAPGP